jgi:hypothetical protein
MRAVLGVWLAGVTATLSVMTKLAAPIGHEGAAYGSAGSAQGLGWGLGPIVGSGIVALGGIPALYLVCAAATVCLLPLIRARIKATVPSIVPAMAYDPSDGQGSVAGAVRSTSRRLK